MCKGYEKRFMGTIRIATDLVSQGHIQAATDLIVTEVRSDPRVCDTETYAEFCVKNEAWLTDPDYAIRPREKEGNNNG